MKCNSSEHILWYALLGIPMVLIWGIIFPIWGFMIMKSNLMNLDKWEIQKYFLFLNIGLKQEVYFWEFVNTIRKLLLLTIPIILQTVSSNYKALLIIVLLVIMLRVHKSLKPYKKESYNDFEYDEITTT